MLAGKLIRLSGGLEVGQVGMRELSGVSNQHLPSAPVATHRALGDPAADDVLEPIGVLGPPVLHRERHADGETVALRADSEVR
jgi:hypothetical protein